MAYEPLTFTKFKKQLGENHYDNVSGARRAVGKASSFTSDEKEKAYKLVNAQFGEAATAKPEKPAKVKAEKAAKPAKAAKAEKAPKAEAKTEKPVKTRAKRGSAVKLLTVTPDEARLHFAERIINSATNAITALNGVRDEKETKAAVVRVIADATTLLASGIAAARDIIPDTKTVNGVGHALNGKAALEQSLPA